MSDRDFWDLTFEELDALIERRRELDERAEYQNLLIVCSVFNSQRTDKKQKFLTPEDFMAGAQKKEAPKVSLISQIDVWAMAAFGINNQGELEARERIAREEAEALAASVCADS